MPIPRTWLPRIYEIIQVLENSKAAEFDRPAIEKLFEIQRRTALLLIKQVGAIKSGIYHVVPRKALLAWVKKIEKAEGSDIRYRLQVTEHLDQEMAEYRAAQAALRQANKPPIQFTLSKDILKADLASLAPNVEVTQGRIVITFDPTDPVQACELLYGLACALANDFTSFTAATEKQQPVRQ